MRVLELVVAPSTRELFRLRNDARPYRLRDFIHGYVYGRWTYLYIAIATGEHPLARVLNGLLNGLNALRRALPGRRTTRTHPTGTTFADTYHGKVVPLDHARQLITVDRDVTVRDLEQVIPYTKARDIVLHNPDHIVVLDCPCRSSREHPCLPLDVCLIIGEPFASFVHDHHPATSRWITPDEAVAILESEDNRGHVHHAFFKDAMLNRFYAICNCCSCCCGAMQAHQHGTPMLASSGFVCRVDDDRCQACGDCTEVCQFGALTIHEMQLRVDAARCMGCGVCQSRCGYEALTLVRERERGIPLEIRTLMDAASSVP